MNEFAVNVSQVGPATVVAIQGEVGILEVEQLDARLARVANEKPAIVVIDLSGVRIMGSCAMGSLMGFRRDLARNAGALRLAQVDPLVLESFRRARLDKVLPIFPTVDAALSPAPG